MSLSATKIAWRGFRFYLRPHTALALAVAAATAVLLGALVVGSSMRGSLRELTFERLAAIDEVIVGDHFFREALCDEIRHLDAFGQNYTRAEPAILFPSGTVDTQRDGRRRRSSQVTILGVAPTFWELQDATTAASLGPLLDDDRVFINRTLADELGIDDQAVEQGLARITLRIPKPTWMPGDSSLGEKRDLVSSLVDLSVAKILENNGLGRFSLEPSQRVPTVLYVPLATMQEFLSRETSVFRRESRLINAVFLAGKDPRRPPAADSWHSLRAALRPQPMDLGLNLDQVKLAHYDGAVMRVDHEYLSLTTSRLVFSDAQVAALRNSFPDLKPASTYLINLMRPTDPERAGATIPYSMLTAIDFDAAFAPLSVDGTTALSHLDNDALVLNQWAAEDLGVQVGDELELIFFEPESTHGQQKEQSVKLKLAAVAAFTEPDRPFGVRGSEVIPAEYRDPPTLVNDPKLTPEVPGLSDATTIENWDVPFPLSYRIRSQDDEYWALHRTTPKGFVSLATGLKLWHSRFGAITNLRLPASRPEAAVHDELIRLWRDQPSLFGLDNIPVKRQGLSAAAGSTPFDALFLGLSMFIIASALILVSLLFRLGLEQRSEQVGLMSALGWPGPMISGVWLREMFLVCVVGGALGVLGGIGFGAAIIMALKTWWLGAIATPFLRLHLEPWSLSSGFLIGLAVSLLTILLGIRSMVRRPARELLRGGRNLSASTADRGAKGWVAHLLAAVSLLAAVALAVAATGLGGESQAGAFVGSGFLLLFALLIEAHSFLSRRQTTESATTIRSLATLASQNLRRHPLRSTLTIGLVSVATFLIIAIGSFRLQPTSQSTGGASWIAESDAPVFADLGLAAEQRELLGDPQFFPSSLAVYSWRLKPGQDASCNNLYRATQPQVQGVSREWIERFDPPAQKSFLWSGVQAQSAAERDNPWRMLSRRGQGTVESPIPAVLDKNTAMYSLKIFGTGSLFTVTYDSGETVTYLITGFLENSLFQGSLLISEENFRAAFPYLSGYRTLLFVGEETPEHAAVLEKLEDRLGDWGVDVRRSSDLLRGFASVQNTYLTAFQSLGGLGLLLGTLGLAAVQLRSIVERRKELAVLRAIGFDARSLRCLLFFEQSFVLLLGLAIGTVVALAATIPHWLASQGGLPWLHLAVILGIVIVVGLASASLTARSVLCLPVCETLKSG